jgi:methionyl aminopeptidase
VIPLKSEAQLEALRQAAALVGQAHAEVASRIRPGVSTLELDRVAEEVLRDGGARPAFKGYAFPGATPFPGTLCISVNDVVVHGMPAATPLSEGDVVSIDCGAELGGYYGDFAYTYEVGEVSEKKRALLAATKQSLYEGIRHMKEGKRLGDVAYAVQSYCEARGLGIVRDLVGHGIGRKLHEDPQVPNFGKRGTGKKLRAGMTLCLEPMVTAGTEQVVVDADGWTVRTADGQPAAHFEHMVAIRRGGPPELLSSFEPIEAALAAAGFPIPGVPVASAGASASEPAGVLS